VRTDFLDRPAGLLFDVPGDGERGEHDGQVRVGRLPLVVVDRPGPTGLLELLLAPLDGHFFGVRRQSQKK
jgi:hypothetical protein